MSGSRFTRQSTPAVRTTEASDEDRSIINQSTSSVCSSKRLIDSPLTSSNKNAMLLLLRLLLLLPQLISLSVVVLPVADAFSVSPSPIRRFTPSFLLVTTKKARGDDSTEENDLNSNALQTSSNNIPATSIDTTQAAATQLQQRSPEDLVNIILQYEQQMQSFAIQAQREKLRAVREAEDALLEQWALTSSTAGTTSTSTGSLPSSSSSSNVQQRDAKIVTEGSRNTRWGPQEIARIQLGAGRVGGGPPSSSSSSAIQTATTSGTTAISDATITAADHGLRADGGVGGPTLEERLRRGAAEEPSVGGGGVVVPSSVVTMGAVTLSSVQPSSTTKSDAFAQRTTHVAQQGSRNTRWGPQEIQRVQQQQGVVGSATGGPSSSSAGGPALRSSVVTLGSTAAGVPTDMIQQADHGLRADGGVGGPTLADRVNVGAQLILGQTTSSSSSNTAYAQRNEKLRAGGGDTDTRWGPQEIARISGGSTSIGSVAGGPSSTAATAPTILRSSVVTMGGTAPTVPADVIAAADHGLRADGGVGGPTLADRVNVGAQLIAAGGSSTAVTTPRDAKVAAQGNANTRWGPQEVARVQAAGGTGLATGGPAPTSGGVLPSSVVTIGAASTSASTPVPDDVIAAADHGLRADGGVGGPTLADRLNANDVGSAAPAATASVPPPVNGHAAESSPVFFATTTVVSNEYKKRSENVAASGTKNTRWGAQEIARAQAGATATGLVTGGPASSVARRGVLPSSVVSIGTVAAVASAVDAATIAAADHGLRADGGVGGPTLADRLNNVNVGAQIVSGKTSASASSSSAAAEYNRRNSKIAEEGAMNTRWGAQEIARVTKGTAGTVTGGPPSSSAAAPALRSTVVTLNGSGAQEHQASVSEDMIVAADHGLRADGGVGGPTLADRLQGAVNVGAKIVSAAAPSSLYEQRNKQVAAAASQSRWGAQEVNRIQNGAGGVGSNGMKVGVQIQLTTS